MIVSVTLARGAIRMAKAQVIVKRLGAIHDLGSMDVLCTDKTGTLTEAKIKLARQVALSGADSPHVFDLAWLNSHFQAGLRNPLDAAIVESGPPRDAGWTKIDEVPFDFQRRRVSVLVEHEGRRLLITKGAPEDVLKLATRYEEPGKPEPLPLDDAARARAAKVFEELGAEGFRALGVAWRELEPDRSGSGGGRRAGFGVCRLCRLLRPAKSKRGGGHRRARGQGCRRQDPQRRQRARDAACLHRARHSDHRAC